jgi:hypothetical protein
MPCCKAEEYIWCKDLPVVSYMDTEGNEYCVFHAPKGLKGISLEEFNKLVFERIDSAKKGREHIDLGGTIFEGYISFNEFNKDNPLYDISFCKATFNDVAGFSGATFNDVANFIGTTFNERAIFIAAAFSKVANFSTATFNDEANFTGAVFSKGANFSSATFNDEAGFSGATFNDEADFMIATFNERANFSVTAK